jgi:hypothetical protein
MLDLNRSNARRDTFAWKRGETTAAGQLIAFNGITAEALWKRGLELVKRGLLYPCLQVKTIRFS